MTIGESKPRPRPSRVSHPERSLTSRLTRLSLLAPTTREVGLKPVRWSLLALPLVALGLVLAVREVARVERVLSAEGSRAQRVIVYELRPGGELRVPMEAGTEVFRIVAHAMKAGALTDAPHEARVSVTAVTEAGATRRDEVKVVAPGASTRVAPEEGSLVVGDPVALNFDAHGLGKGELKIALSSIVDADALLVRIYRREVVGADKVAERPERLGVEGRARLAHLAGEVDWNELDADEQATLLGERWRRVAALPNANKGLVTHAIVLATPPSRDTVPDPDPMLSAWDIRDDERVAIVAHGRNLVRARADGDPEAKVVATVRHLDGRVDTIEGKGEVRVDVPLDYEVAIELWRSSPGFLSLRASDPERLETATHVAAWRTTPTRPVVVTAGKEPLVLRVTARRPIPRNANETFGIVLDATITGGVSTASHTSVNQSVMLRASRARSIYDRYDVRTPDAAPTATAVFHLVVPAAGTLTLTPAEGQVDLSLAELDPKAAPRPVPAYPAEKPWPKVAKSGESDWGGWAARRPTNFTLFERAAPSGEIARLVLRVPHRYVEVKEPESKVPGYRIHRPKNVVPIIRGNRTFDPTTVSFEIELAKGEPLVLPVRLFAREKLDVVARVDAGFPVRTFPVRIEKGVAERITTARGYVVEDEVRTIMVLGDDLPPGRHVLTFTPPAGKQAWVHLPWTATPRLPGAPPPDPHWIEGDLED